MPYISLGLIWRSNMQQIFYLLVKEFKQIFRMREMVAIIFGVPLVQMVILGFTITNEVKNVSLLISDQDDSQISREIVRAFGQTDRFNIIAYELDRNKIEESIQSWNAQMALIIPKNFARDFELNTKPQIQILVDGIDGNTAGVALGYAQGILHQAAVNIFMNPFVKFNIRSNHTVNMEERMFYNLNQDNAQFMIPGIVVVLLTIISMMLSAINLVREKEIGTLEQLMVTPLKRYQLLLGKILPFLILTFFELFLVMACAKIIFSIQVHGSYFLLAGLAFLFLFTTLGLGIFVSTITSSQQQAMFISWFLMVFMIMMSGFFIPIENMPDILQKLTYLNPMRYFLYIMRDIIQKGSSLNYILIDVIPMTIYGLIIFILSALNFQKRLA
jgi:ABC-2 type transport system permease protein